MALNVALILFTYFSYACSQSTTTTTLPPLQWLDLTGLLSGTSKPPPLKDASIGYDETSRSIIIFGGESEGGFPQSQTYLLNLDTLLWYSPNPPNTLQNVPSARSAAVAGCDFAASNRHGFVVIGGKGSNGRALSDVWEFDFTNQFWSQVSVSPGGPSPRWGAAGGIDFRTPPTPDPILPGPNNSFYLAGGYDGTSVRPISDVWRFNVSGTLSSNLPDDSFGSWEQIEFEDLPESITFGSTTVGNQVIIAGGCSDTIRLDNSCARQDSYVLHVEEGSVIVPSPCPAPRKGPSVVPNVNTASNSFSSQVFLLLGTFDSSLWDDQDALQKGEVAVLDFNTGTWSRVLPAGDPGSSGNPTYPTPREGAAAVTYSSGLVGAARSSSDTIVFGGRDADGNYLSEVWLLRAYSGIVTDSSTEWPGFGDGNLETGVNASGSGVRLEYISSCASALSQTNPSPTESSTGTSTSASDDPTPTSSLDPSSGQTFDTSVLHKIFAPVSVALILPGVLLYRMSLPSSGSQPISGLFPAGVLLIIGYGLGVAGLVLSFTTNSTSSNVSAFTKRRALSTTMLQTAHGKAGFTLFVGMYGLVPAVVFLFSCWKHIRFLQRDRSDGHTNGRDGSTSPITAEKTGPARPIQSPPQSLDVPSRPSSPRPRTQSWGLSSLWRTSEEERMSTDSESAISSAPQRRTFEVVNRPRRRMSDHNRRLAVPSDSTKGLSHIDWLRRRRSLNAVGELDYALTQAYRAQHSPSTPTTTDVLVGSSRPGVLNSPQTPHIWDIILHVFFHVFLLGLCLLSLVALWFRAPRATFAVFLVWATTFYVLLLVLAWHGRPAYSILTVIIARLRAESFPTATEPPSHTPTRSPIPEGQYPFPSSGPYVHQPLYRAAHPSAHETMSVSLEGPRSDDDDDDDDDEDTRQMRIENEMERREVSIVTVPRRKLWITNPS